jgi:hypothetical protein
MFIVYSIELSILTKTYDLRSASKWRQHVEQTREKVRTDLDVTSTSETTIGDVCKRKAVNLVRLHR